MLLMMSSVKKEVWRVFNVLSCKRWNFYLNKIITYYAISDLRNMDDVLIRFCEFEKC